MIFDIIIVNLNVGSYLHMMPKKGLSKAGKEKKDLYLQACLERRHSLLLCSTLSAEYLECRP